MRTKLTIAAVLMLVMGVTSGAGAEGAAYVGAKKCKTCHIKIYKKWLTTGHAKAFDQLQEAERQDPKCLECHVTNNDVNLPGVHCEVCHGPGGDYTSSKIMNKKKYRADAEKQRKLAVDAGLVIAPDEKKCKQCHNERSPHYKGFDFKQRYEEIKHQK